MTRALSFVSVAAAALALASGCAGQLEDTVRARAAAEFPCAAGEITVSPGGEGSEGWRAEGCGKADTYFVRCVGLGRSCSARNSTEQREYEEARAELEKRRANQDQRLVSPQ